MLRTCSLVQHLLASRISSFLISGNFSRTTPYEIYAIVVKSQIEIHSTRWKVLQKFEMKPDSDICWVHLAGSTAITASMMMRTCSSVKRLLASRISGFLISGSSSRTTASEICETAVKSQIKIYTTRWNVIRRWEMKNHWGNTQKKSIPRSIFNVSENVSTTAITI